MNRKRFCMCGDVFGRAGSNDVAAVLARLRPKVDHPVGGLDNVQIVLDDHHRVAEVYQAVEHVEQLGQVVEVQPRRRLVQQIERAPGVGPREFGGQLHALGLAPGEGRGRLSERHVVEPHVVERLQCAADLAGHSRTVAAPASTTSPARRQSTARGTSPPGSAARSGGRGRRRTRPTRRAGSASRSSTARSPRTSRSGPPGTLKLNRRGE